MTGNIPTHLPARLTVSLWDFSWYTMTMPGEPFHDLDHAFAETAARGYNTARICAMPYLLFGPGGDARGPLRFTNLGGDFGQHLEAIADWAGLRGIPAVIGEGYVGYTPLLATFEEGPDRGER